MEGIMMRHKENGWMLFEIGYDQGEAVKALMRENGFFDVQIVKDLMYSAEIDRLWMRKTKVLYFSQEKPEEHNRRKTMFDKFLLTFMLLCIHCFRKVGASEVLEFVSWVCLWM